MGEVNGARGVRECVCVAPLARPPVPARDRQGVLGRRMAKFCPAGPRMWCVSPPHQPESARAGAVPFPGLRHRDAAAGAGAVLSSSSPGGVIPLPQPLVGVRAGPGETSSEQLPTPPFIPMPLYPDVPYKGMDEVTQPL